jgi:hypothetical protein
MLDSMYVTMSICTRLYSKLDLWNANKLYYITLHYNIRIEHSSLLKTHSWTSHDGVDVDT